MLSVERPVAGGVDCGVTSGVVELDAAAWLVSAAGAAEEELLLEAACCVVLLEELELCVASVVGTAATGVLEELLLLAVFAFPENSPPGLVATFVCCPFRSVNTTSGSGALVLTLAVLEEELALPVLVAAAGAAAGGLLALTFSLSLASEFSLEDCSFGVASEDPSGSFFVAGAHWKTWGLFFSLELFQISNLFLEENCQYKSAAEICLA